MVITGVGGGIAGSIEGVEENHAGECGSGLSPHPVAMAPGPSARTRVRNGPDRRSPPERNW